ncbi:MAG: hypothetical protein ACREAY_05005 [Nitrososphaera sp.]|uniref:hypothetical protein n=1 Tax=Nitrososphaera sp. TaxID=1971748 RepID=UPI003D6EBDDB
MTRIVNATFLLGVFCIAESLAIFSGMPTVFACSCNGPIPQSEAFDESAAVFAGKVVSIESSNYSKTVHFDAERPWKGVTESAITITTGAGGGDCGYGFEEGREYLVYAYGSESLGTGICGRTQPIMDAYVDLAALGPGYVPSQSPTLARDVANVGILALAAAACAAIVGVVAFGMVRQWRRK